MRRLSSGTGIALDVKTGVEYLKRQEGVGAVGVF